MVDIKAHHLTDGALSDRRMTSACYAALGGLCTAPKMPQTDRATASVQTAISIRRKSIRPLAASGYRLKR